MSSQGLRKTGLIAMCTGAFILVSGIQAGKYFGDQAERQMSPELKERVSLQDTFFYGNYYTALAIQRAEAKETWNKLNKDYDRLKELESSSEVNEREKLYNLNLSRSRIGYTLGMLGLFPLLAGAFVRGGTSELKLQKSSQ